MQIQIDSVWSGQDENNREEFGVIPDGAAFRRARFGMFGDYGPWEYRIAMDFALSGHPSFIDVFIALNDVPVLDRVRVGHFFEPFGLEHYSQNRFITIPGTVAAERRCSDRRGTSASWRTTTGPASAAPGPSASSTPTAMSSATTRAIDFQSAVTGRVSFLPWYNTENEGRDLLARRRLVLGPRREGRSRSASARGRRCASARPNRTSPISSTPVSSRPTSTSCSTPRRCSIRGPFSLQSEYQLMPVSTLDRGAVYFQSWYVLGSVFLTGENRAYRKTTGVLERIIPHRDFISRDNGCFAIGPGAWELACRVSHLDLTNGGVTGGRLTDVTLGVNWYMSPYVRMTANYIKAIQTPDDGRAGTADFFGHPDGLRVLKSAARTSTSASTTPSPTRTRGQLRREVRRKQRSFRAQSVEVR